MRLPARLGVALAELDHRPALLATLRRLRRRLPGDPEFGDELSTAGERTLAYLVQGVNALSPERESVVSELGLAGLQIWQSLAEASGRGRGEVELALLYADVVDSSALALAAGDEVAVELLQTVARTLEHCVTARGGRIVRRMGDGIIASFISGQAAIEAALDIETASRGIAVGGYHVRLRLGVHWGRPRKLRGDLVGTDVNVVAAVGKAARPGQVLVSAAALAQLDPAFHRLAIGRRKRLRSEEAPPELTVAVVRRS